MQRLVLRLAVGNCTKQHSVQRLLWRLAFGGSKTKHCAHLLLLRIAARRHKLKKRTATSDAQAHDFVTTDTKVYKMRVTRA